jgi:hypothetical protein
MYWIQDGQLREEWLQEDDSVDSTDIWIIVNMFSKNEPACPSCILYISRQRFVLRRSGAAPRQARMAMMRGALRLPAVSSHYPRENIALVGRERDDRRPRR